MNLCALATILCSNPELSNLLETQVPTMMALAKGSKSVTIVQKPEEVPEGCSTDTVGADIVVNLLIKVRRTSRVTLRTLLTGSRQGLVNIDAEIAKAQKKITAAQTNVERLKKVVAKAETPEEVKTSSAEQVKVLEAEMAALQLSVEQFRKMGN